MANTHETIADIIAEMLGARTEFPFVYLMGEPDTPEVIDPKTKDIIEPRKINIRRVTVKELADRLKAAHKRERGDCAKLREALVYVNEHTYRDDNDDLREEGCRRIEDVIDEALAAPPRNCDKYATADEALKAQEQMFNDSNFANGECKLGCPECDNPRVGCKIAWLFAPATEKEGGAK